MFNVTEQTERSKYNEQRILDLAITMRDTGWAPSSVLVVSKTGDTNVVAVLSDIFGGENSNKKFDLGGTKYTGDQIVARVAGTKLDKKGPTIWDGRHRALGLVVAYAFFGTSLNPTLASIPESQGPRASFEANARHEFATKLAAVELIDGVVDGVRRGEYTKEAHVPVLASQRGMQQKLWGQAQLIVVYEVDRSDAILINKEDAREALKQPTKSAVHEYVKKCIDGKVERPEALGIKELDSLHKKLVMGDPMRELVLTQFMDAVMGKNKVNADRLVVNLIQDLHDKRKALIESNEPAN